MNVEREAAPRPPLTEEDLKRCEAEWGRFLNLRNERGEADSWSAAGDWAREWAEALMVEARRRNR